jgi:hypothetical protein
MKIGDVFEVQTSKGNAYLHYTFKDEKLGDLVRVFSGPYKKEVDITWSPEYELYTSMYDNIFSFLDTTIECFDKRIYFVNEDRALELDFEKEIEVARNLNKRARYWKI